MARGLAASLAAIGVVTATGCFNPKLQPDAGSTADAGPASVRVLAYSWGTAGTPLLEAPVLVHDENNQLVSRTTTGVGAVFVTVPGGGKLTVVETNRALTTFLGVEDGDVIVVGQGGTVAQASYTSIRLPDGPPGTQRYSVHAQCASGSGNSSNVGTFFTSRCGSGPRDVLAFAETAIAATHSVFQPAVPFVAGTPINIGGAWQPLANLSVSLGGLSSGGTNSAVHGVRNGGRLVWATQTQLPAATAGVATAPIPQPAVGDQSLVGYVVERPTTRSTVYELLASRVDRYDVASIVDAALDEPVGLQVSASSASWTIASRAVRADVTLATMVARRSGQDGATWYLVLPPAATNVDFPQLPSDLANVWQPDDGIRATIMLGEGTAFDPDAFRTDLAGTRARYRDTPAPATVRIQEVFGEFPP